MYLGATGSITCRRDEGRRLGEELKRAELCLRKRANAKGWREQAKVNNESLEANSFLDDKLSPDLTAQARLTATRKT